MKTNLQMATATFFFILLSIVGLKAQSIQAINAPEVVYGSVNDDLLTTTFDVQNTSNINMNVYAKRVENSVLEGTENYFCWFQCYSSSTDVSPTPLFIAAGASVSNFYADYQPQGVEGSSFIDYCFYNADNPSDQTCVTVEFRVSSATAVNEAEMISIGSPQPNPAVDHTVIPFDLKENNKDAALVVYNILGSEIKRQSISGTSGNIDLNVSDLQAGVYIYSFYNNNRLLASSRLVVR